MQSINRFLYGPTPEERVRQWQTKLRSESRQLDREMRQVWNIASVTIVHCIDAIDLVRHRDL